jgi:hypothetical protein
MVSELIRLLDKNLSNAIALLALSSSMSAEEQLTVNLFIEEVLDTTSLTDLKEKEVLNYMKLYLKTRKETMVSLEDLVNDTQRQRLEGLGQ